MESLQYLDTTLRDGSHAVHHEFTAEQYRAIVAGLVAAKVGRIEIGHGAGLGGSSLLQGLGRVENVALFEAAAEVRGEATLYALLVPGIGVLDELREAVDHGITGVRVATHATEADVGLQHLQLGRALGVHTVGFLMMTHQASPGVLTEQGRMMEDAGAEVVYLADSAGHMVPSDVTARVEPLRAALSCPVGIHAHNNLGLALGNSLAAVEAGATYVDGSMCGLGAGAGNTAGEVFAVVAERLGLESGLDALALMDVAHDTVNPLLKRPQVIDRTSLLLGQAGLYSSFLLKAEEVGRRYGIDPRPLVLEAGRRGAVGGQEDLLEQIALELQEAASV